ncbi:MAG: aspartate--tRNA ligase [Lachnospiraceae bacterium]|uniref:aspartate--tRNA ligase n=1 Tax=Falcatimonas sp. MSJ-15 TaxID=2841515 RepID=UPI001C10A50D|nr:aspartate--tRNA ligase [Falcatimonas sp. MSJ-15]MBQ5734702.1 aspartate--tRNA ligase [Lachnospiraceae bacterium]MBU5468790.1 aspartate--tRNA ligase [Falcatimonas sp. MSJ-15]MEE0958732.1 aspartate--tRNA ligase [Lachnospiraceae bacterium]
MAEAMRGLKRTHRCTEVSNKNIGETVTVMGWVQKKRNLGSLVFADLRDRSGLLQIVFDTNDIGEEGFEKAGTLRSEFVIAVVGKVEARSGAVNDNLATGDIEIRATELRILSEAEVPPFHIEENSQTKEDLRLKYRYLDLRRPDLQRNLMVRSKVATLARAFMANEGFLEIETPMLTKSTPEGARDYLVPSRVHPGTFYALPQSPQLFKQLLMCSGYDRYFQIARCFRDEDLRADRQPEFTQMDMELSFVDVDDVIDVNERLLAHLFKEVLDVDVKLPIQRMTWQEAMDRFGSDKPDLRFGMELKDISEVVKNCGFSVFTSALENGGSVRGINANGQGHMPRKKIDALVDFAKGYGAKGLAYIAINEDGTYKSSFAKFMTDEEMNAIVDKMEGKPGDLLLFAADKNKIVYEVLGALRLEIANNLGILDKNEYRFVWITEFPLLEWSDEQNRYVAMHHPFTMPMDEDLDKLDTDPGAVRAKAYDIVLNGTEIGGGSVRIYQNEVQEKMFEVLGFTKEAAYDRFGFLLNAFKYGVPPHAGLAYGLDRLVMLMVKADSIREVIAFPKVKDASCLMTNAPDVVDDKQLEELYLNVVPVENEEAGKEE